MTDGYRIADAARVLGVSPKRVRQLVAEDRLPLVEGSSPMAVEVEAVHRERDRRRHRPASTPGPEPTPLTVAVSVETLLQYAERITSRALDAAMADRRAADAARDQAEDLLRASLAEATQRAAAAEAEDESLRERMAAKPWKRKKRQRQRVMVSPAAACLMRPLTVAAGTAALLLLTVGCTSGSAPSESGDTGTDTQTQALISTPLEAADALKGLGAFSECTPPQDDDAGVMGSVKCYIITDWMSGDGGTRYRRGVFVAVLRSASPATFCSYSFPPEAAEDFEIVTDGKTFVAFGEMSDVWALPETWAWPSEIWPADVARVLGGTVTTAAETCPTT